MVRKKTYGHNKLSSTVKRLCSKAEITGYKTNHSLRASRLYQAGVDEQLVMERTSHHSIEGVRSYKRTSYMQQQCFSDILNSKSLEENMNVTSINPTTLTPAQITISFQSMYINTKCYFMCKCNFKYKIV